MICVTAMSDDGTILDAVRAALRSEAVIALHEHPLALTLADDHTLIIEGEVLSVAAKKRALEQAAAVGGIDGIIDRIRVAPAQDMGDGAIRDDLRTALLQEPSFATIALREIVKAGPDIVREPAGPAGFIEYAVQDGVVTLNGEVPGLAYKRLAGVLAWWIPGSRDVVNGIAVEPAEEDNDGEVSDAVRLALEKDGFVDASQVRVSAHDFVVTLDGLVPSPAERDMAERDAWYVFGVDNVVNRLVVRP